MDIAGPSKHEQAVDDAGRDPGSDRDREPRLCTQVCVGQAPRLERLEEPLIGARETVRIEDPDAFDT